LENKLNNVYLQTKLNKPLANTDLFFPFFLTFDRAIDLFVLVFFSFVVVLGGGTLWH
jgi:hypothetical protein